MVGDVHGCFQNLDVSRFICDVFTMLNIPNNDVNIDVLLMSFVPSMVS